MTVRTALLLIAHGSRQEEANADLHHAVAALRRRSEFAVVEPAFLELAEPTIEDGAAKCVAQGAGRVILLPYFLSAGTHVRLDLTAMCRQLAMRFPEVSFDLAEPLGRHPLLVDMLGDRAREALAARDSPSR
jgi:sirohydrochlorin ferrochelatase